jgi:hypothetical protein
VYNIDEVGSCRSYLLVHEARSIKAKDKAEEIREEDKDKDRHKDEYKA